MAKRRASLAARGADFFLGNHDSQEPRKSVPQDTTIRKVTFDLPASTADTFERLFHTLRLEGARGADGGKLTRRELATTILDRGLDEGALRKTFLVDSRA